MSASFSIRVSLASCAARAAAALLTALGTTFGGTAFLPASFAAAGFADPFTMIGFFLTAFMGFMDFMGFLTTFLTALAVWALAFEDFAFIREPSNTRTEWPLAKARHYTVLTRERQEKRARFTRCPC